MGGRGAGLRRGRGRGLRRAAPPRLEGGLAGERAFGETGEWLPPATVDAFREHLVGIKGPLTTPVGGGIRSLNVALRQKLDLYVCVRPVRWYHGVPSPCGTPSGSTW